MKTQYRRIVRNLKIAKRVIRHYRKTTVSRRPDISWDFFQFERSVNTVTWDRHDDLSAWAQACAQRSDILEERSRYEASDDPVARQGYTLMQDVKRKFKGRLRGQDKLRVLIHVPSWKNSPGGYSAYSNLLQALDFIGIPVQALGWDQTIEPLLKSFSPTIFITSDHDSYLKRINWDALALYRKKRHISVGLAASLEEYGNTPLPGRLECAQKNRGDFYYSFRAPEYYEQWEGDRPFYDKGYKIYSIEFGANPDSY